MVAVERVVAQITFRRPEALCGKSKVRTGQFQNVATAT